MSNHFPFGPNATALPSEVSAVNLVQQSDGSAAIHVYLKADALGLRPSLFVKFASIELAEIVMQDWLAQNRKPQVPQ